MSCVSTIQLEANRENAKRSTGPRSEDGKTKSSRNAMKFGIYSNQVLLPGEDAAVYESFRDGMYKRLKPLDELERLLADRVVLAAWKLRRVQAAEGTKHAELRKQYARSGLRNVEPSAVTCYHLDTFEYYAKIEAALERSMYRAMAELRKAQAQRGDDDDEAEEQVERKNEPISDATTSVEAPANEVVCKNEPISPLAPSPGTPGFPCTHGRWKGGGEGDFGVEPAREVKSPSS